VSDHCDEDVPTRAAVRSAVLSLLLASIPLGLAACNSDAGPAPVGNTATRAVGQDPRERQVAVGPRAGRWAENRPGPDESELTDEQRAEMARLAELGYASGVHAGGGRSGVTRHTPGSTAAGMLQLTSAHGPTSMLLDDKGNILHRWQYGFRKAFPERPGTLRGATFWRRTHLFENGDLLAIFEGLAILKLDKDSNLIWSRLIPAHHDMALEPDGSIWVLTREPSVIPAVHETQPVLEDFVSLLDSNGEETRRISLLDALERSDYSDHWDGGLGISGDLFHVNSLERLDGSIARVDPVFREGNLLISSRHLDHLAVLDPDSERIVWAMKGAFNAQHDPQILDNGNILLFDNNVLGEASRVVELDPATGAERWVYEGSASEPFYSETCGLAQRLPGGNTLITESDYGRAFEVTASGDIVWEFYNPFRAGDENQYIATMMEMKRLPPDFPTDWLDR
jgi:hypothetical protein